MNAVGSNEIMPTSKFEAHLAGKVQKYRFVDMRALLRVISYCHSIACDGSATISPESADKRGPSVPPIGRELKK